MATQKDVLQWNVQGSRGAVLIPLEKKESGNYGEATVVSKYCFDLVGDDTEMTSPSSGGSDSGKQHVEFKSSTNRTVRIPINSGTDTLQPDGKFKSEEGEGGTPVYPEVSLHVGNTPLAGGTTRVSLPAWIKAKLKMQKGYVIVGFDMGKLVGDNTGHSTGWLLGRLGEVKAKPKEIGEMLKIKSDTVKFDESLNLGDITFKNLDGQDVTLHAPSNLTQLAAGEFDIIEGA